MSRIAKGKTEYYETPLDIFVEDLIELHAELTDDLVVVEAMLVKAGVEIAGSKPASEPKAAPKKRRKASSAKKKRQVSEATRQRVLALVRQQEEPVQTKTIADMVDDLSPGTVSKALSSLVQDGSIEQTGMMQGVRGRRPLFAAVAAPAEAVPAMSRSFPEHEDDSASGNGGRGEEVPQADERPAIPLGPAT